MRTQQFSFSSLYDRRLLENDSLIPRTPISIDASLLKEFGGEYLFLVPSKSLIESLCNLVHVDDAVVDKVFQILGREIFLQFYKNHIDSSYTTLVLWYSAYVLPNPCF